MLEVLTGREVPLKDDEATVPCVKILCLMCLVHICVKQPSPLASFSSSQNMVSCGLGAMSLPGHSPLVWQEGKIHFNLGLDGGSSFSLQPTVQCLRAFDIVPSAVIVTVDASNSHPAIVTTGIVA